MWLLTPKQSNDAIWEALRHSTKFFVLEGLVLASSRHALGFASQSSSTMPSTSSSSSSSSTSCNGSKVTKSTRSLNRFRILARIGAKNEEIVVAVGADLFIIENHWNFIETQLLSAIKTMEEEEVSEDLENDRAIRHYLLMKISTLSRLEVESQLEQEQKMLKKLKPHPSFSSPQTSAVSASSSIMGAHSMMGSNSYFRELFEFDRPTKKEKLRRLGEEEEEETLLAFYSCNLWHKIFHPGGLYLSKNFLCLGSTELRKRFKISLESITNIEILPETHLFSYVIDHTRSLLVVVRGNKEYFFTDFENPEEALNTIEQAWHASIALRSQRKLNQFLTYSSSLCNSKVEAGYSLGMQSGSASLLASPSPFPHYHSAPPAEGNNSNINSNSNTNNERNGKKLRRTISNPLILPLTGLPDATNTPVHLDKCTLRWKNTDSSPQTGDLYVSDRWFSFVGSSTTQITVIIPLVLIRELKEMVTTPAETIASPSIRPVSSQNIIEILTNKNSFFLVFSSARRRGNILTILRTLWSTARKDNRQKEDDKNKEKKRKDLRGQVFKGREIMVKHASTARKKTWHQYYDENGDDFDMVRTPALKELISRGVPNSFRGKIWQLSCLSIYKLLASPDLFQRLLARGSSQPTQATRDIEKDLERSLGISLYKTTEGLTALRNVLVAFSVHNPRIGYCQSMNIIAAMLLLYMTEEEAFFILCTIVEELLPEYYSKLMLGCLVDQEVFHALMKKFMPKLVQHLDDLGLPLSVVCLPWFMCLYVGILPWEITLRCLDRFFSEGACALFQMGLTIFDFFQDGILKCTESYSVLELLKRQPDLKWTANLQVVLNKYTEAVPWTMIQQSRNTHRPKIIKQMATRHRSAETSFTSLPLGGEEKPIAGTGDLLQVSMAELESSVDYSQAIYNLSSINDLKRLASILKKKQPLPAASTSSSSFSSSSTSSSHSPRKKSSSGLGTVSSTPSSTSSSRQKQKRRNVMEVMAHLLVEENTFVSPRGQESLTPSTSKSK